jgi:hypothetical protein
MHLTLRSQLRATHVHAALFVGPDPEHQSPVEELTPAEFRQFVAVLCLGAAATGDSVTIEHAGEEPVRIHDDGPCPMSDPDCEGEDGDCHDACEAQYDDPTPELLAIADEFMEGMSAPVPGESLAASEQAGVWTEVE